MGEPSPRVEDAGMVSVRVLIVDDHLVFAEALSVRLGTEPDIEVVGVVTTAEGARATVARAGVDVAVVDVRLGPADGVDLVRWLAVKEPSVKVIVLTGHDNGRTATAAVKAGARAFLGKGTSATGVVEVIHAVQRGESCIPGPLLTDVLRSLRLDPRHDPGEGLLARLSAREREVLDLMVAGCDRNTIAEQLYLSPETVRTHTQRILSKLEVHSGVEAVAVALSAGARPRRAG